MHEQSAFAAAMDKLVADCDRSLEWVPFSRDRLAREAAQVLVQQWSNCTRHSRQCWAHVAGNCPIFEVRKFIVTENLYEGKYRKDSRQDKHLCRTYALG